MCGIVGYVGDGSSEMLKHMNDALQHRGPDGEGCWVGERVGLGHRRLSIVDLSTRGTQPMADSRGRYQIVFNGEIYNHKELRDNLRHEDISWRSDTDTEVILELYARKGMETFALLRGMFAIGIYDAQEKILVLARDRMGQKPLYWHQSGDTLIFASELKALRRHALGRNFTISQAGLFDYIQNDCVQTPHTIYEGVYKVPRASCIVFSKGSTKVSSYVSSSPHFDTISFSDAAAYLDELLSKSISYRLMADVPVGVWLSGGIDSSIVAWYASKQSQSVVSTFSIGFSESSYDESSYAKEVAGLIGSKHYHKVCTEQDALGIVEKIPDIFDEPVADASVIPTYLLSQFTKRHVTVALGGDGGDELFAGYPTFQADMPASVYGWLPQPARSLFVRGVELLPETNKYLSFATKARAFVSGYSSNMYERHAGWLASFPDKAAVELLGLGSADALGQTGFDGNALLSWYERRYLMDQVLVKVDRASMACGLEARAPFLDHELVDFVRQLPYSYKLKGLKTKALLKYLMKDRLPSGILHRKKQGFGVPVGAWFRGPLRQVLTDTLSESSVRSGGFFNEKYVTRLISEHMSGRINHGKKLWNLFVFELWRQRWAGK